MNKKMWILFGIVLVCLLIGWWVFHHFFSKTTTMSVPNPSGSDSQTITSSMPTFSTSTVQSTSTRLVSLIEVSSQKQDDGLFHTLFTFYIYYPEGSKPPAITVSQELQCPPFSSSTNMTKSSIPFGIRFSLSCTSHTPITDTSGLFQI